MKLIFLFLASFSLHALAADRDLKHQVTFGNDFATRFHGAEDRATQKSSNSLLSDFGLSERQLSLNYAYRIGSHLQVGILFSTDQDRTRAEYRTGGKFQTTISQSAIYGTLTYNFSQQFQDSLFLTAGIGEEDYESETREFINSSLVDKYKFAYDQTAYFAQFGKRFNLEFWNIKNLTWSPVVTYNAGRVAGSLRNSGVKELKGFSFDVLKFDLLF